MTDFKQFDMDSMIQSISDRARANCDLEEGDYQQDGRWWCGKCHTPKQSRYIHPITHQEKLVNCYCQCSMDKLKEERKKQEQEQEFYRIKALKAECVQDRNILSWTFAADDGTNPKMKAAHTYVEKWDEMYKQNYGFLLYGDVGTGKTFFAACIANALLDQGVPVLVTNFSKLVNQLSGFSSDKNEFLNSLNRYKLLVIDDLGVERQSEFVMEQVYNVIDSRYKSGRPMIITTNVPIEDIKSPKDMKYKRIYDRILENCFPMQITGESRRKQVLEDKMKRARELFR